MWANNKRPQPPKYYIPQADTPVLLTLGNTTILVFLSKKPNFEPKAAHKGN